MFDKLDAVAQRYDELSELMASNEVITNPTLLQQYAREQAELGEVVGAYRRYREIERGIAETQALLNDGLEAELRELAQDELRLLREQREALEEQLKVLLLPRDPNDTKDVVVEIRQGTGGDEAGLFAGDLFRMYTRYAETRGWRVEIVTANENESGGFSEVVFEIKGEGAYSRLKYEGGVHRVQRVPATEAKGRIHTSTATVAVLPEMDDLDLHIRDEDLRVDVFRAGGHGGQGVNTTDSAVRITYKPGTADEIVVTSQDERSQLKNKARAMTVLRARLYAREQEKRQRELGESRLAQVGSGARAEKIRTYNFPQDRITDHRVGQNFSGIPLVLAGDLDRIVDALTVHDNAERLRDVGVGV
jgi:peptide chain release factor 1